MNVRIIDQAFAAWVARVESILGRSVDHKHARDAFEIFEPPTKPLTPEEYAYELMVCGHDWQHNEAYDTFECTICGEERD